MKKLHAQLKTFFSLIILLSLAMGLPCSLLAQHSPIGKTINPYVYVSQKEVITHHACVVSAHPLASEVGRWILQQGGNAVDAAIATQLALAVVYPAAGNIGGGGFMVIHLANGKNTVLDYREEAPGKATRDMFLDSLGNPDSRLSLYGALSAGIPGTVAGLWQAWKKYGHLPWRQLVQPAIDLAQQGFAITAMEARWLNESRQDFLTYNTQPVAFVKDTPWKAGDTLRQPELARTLMLIRDQGKKGFYTGRVAHQIVQTMQHHHGLITLQDLRQYRAIERQPLIFDYKGYTIVTVPPPSAGGIMLQQMLGMISFYPIDQWGYGSPQATQLMIEAERRSYADRAQYLGDPDFVKIPIAQLTSADYLQQRISSYTPGKATPSRATQAGDFTHESEETTHLCVLDESGNAVSATYTLNNLYGSKLIVEGAGFLLNDEMDDFSAKPGSPNLYGLTGSEANAIAPHKRMLSSMTPTIVLKNEKPYLITGTPGGSTIITSVFQTIVDILDFHLSPYEAVNNPKFHHQWLPDVVYVEKGFPDSLAKALESMGYRLAEREAIGRTELIVHPEGETITGVGDHRGDDAVAGY
ncbi:gamma-glutamyltransferase [Thermoflavifilum thermophilum]|uniref:Glutathione hydrolase proenzyme n=1 Tax=Thermoflavifilum thermophilum TaxID=1393122 RepID=A0A1I7NF16_9BACT|nr:gamma-glutamyltransferase [Thermoflavifilum thermophilum]SFV33255.1 gamma-glutamyltranspeptidase / glutathione hydrolase [Thermoflavifilum thermophilum]